MAARAVARSGVVDAASVAVEHPEPVVRFYRHGWHSFSVARWVDVATPVAIVPVEELRLGGDDPVHGLSSRHGGSAVGAAEGASGGGVLLLGALDLGGRVEFDGRGLTGTFEGPAGRWFVAFGPEEEVFARYAALLAERFGARKGRTPRTWSSWYSFYRQITEDTLRDVLRGLRGLPFDCFQIDDGWERGIGDWEPNDGFPAGMAPIAAEARDAGFLPGLWLAPFMAQRGAPVLREHPEWFVHGDDGELVRAGRNWGDHYFGLDLTHPDALAHVAETIRRAIGWGYGFLKLDFLFAAAVPGRRHDDVSREEAYRRGVELVRRAAGDDVYLLACGAPIVPSLGVFDGIRIGPDVAPYWDNALATRHLRALTESGARNAIVTSVHRLWLQPVIDVDPDVVYFRARHQMLSSAQQAYLQDLARVCRFRATSDPPAWLDPHERAALELFLAEEPTVRRSGRYTFTIDGRVADFTPVATADLDLSSEAFG